MKEGKIVKYAVTNVYEWVGFHFADCLLESGEEVIGCAVAETGNQRYLEMFFGRNAGFQQVDQLDASAQYDAIFDVGDVQARSVCFAPGAKKFTIGKKVEDRTEEQLVIHTPLLIGTWMPMNQDGVFENGQFISFQDEAFKNSLSIDSLVFFLLQLLHTSKLPETITIHSNTNPMQENQERQMIYTIDDQPAIEKKRHLVKHFHDHPDFFQP